MNVGFAGDQHAGKSTLIAAIAEVDPNVFQIESWHPIGEVADKLHEQMPSPPQPNDIAWMNRWMRMLPNIIKEVLHTDCTSEQISFTKEDVQRNPADYEKLFIHSVNLSENPELALHRITEENKPLYRPFLQFIGGHLVSHVKNTIWYDEIYTRVNTAKELGAEDATIGGVRYKSDYESMHSRGDIVLKVIRPGLVPRDTTDPTERERNSWQPDITVYNSGSVNDLRNFAPVLWEDLKSGDYKPEYISKD